MSNASIIAKGIATQSLLGLLDTTAREPVIAGTTIEVYRIAALLDGMTVAEILRDYPSLDEQTISAIQVYVEGRPKAGRAYPTMTAKKVMRETCADDADRFLPARE